MDIGQNIKNEREQQQLSREELAEAVGKSFDFIGKVERGARRISVEDLARVAKVLGRPLEFFTGEGGEPEVERELQKLIQSAKLDPADSAELQRLPRLRSKEAVVNFAKSLQATHFGLFRYRLHETEIEVLPDGGAQRWYHRRIEVLDSELPELKVRYILNCDPRSASLEAFTIDLMAEGCSRKEGKMRIGPVYVPSNIVYYSVVFEPPLRRGEVADVCCVESFHKAYAMTRNELKELIKAGKVPEDKQKETTSVDVSVPTDFVRRRITFPMDYEISEIDVDVLVKRMRLRDECERIKKAGCLSMMKIGNRWALELSVEKPIVGAVYQINWQPPTKEDYEKLLGQG